MKSVQGVFDINQRCFHHKSMLSSLFCFGLLSGKFIFCKLAASNERHTNIHGAKMNDTHKKDISVNKCFYYLLLYMLFFFRTYDVQAFFEKDLLVLNMENGLADNWIEVIHKDKDGFMWFGTNNGLSRYDGSKIKNFSLPNQVLKVSRIKEADDDMLWVLCNSRLYCFDRKREAFIPVENADVVYDYRIQDGTTFWYVYSKSLFKCEIDYTYDKERQIKSVQLKEINAYTYNEQIPENLYFHRLCFVGENEMFIGASNGRVYQFDRVSEQLRDITCWDVRDNMQVNHLLLSGQTLWISTVAEGLIQYNLTDGSYQKYTYTPENRSVSLSHTDVHDFVSLGDESFLAVTWNGYTLLTPDKKTPGRYTTEIYNNTASQVHRNLETRMISVYYDPNGILWVGTQGGGVLSSDLRKQFYKSYNQDTHNEICGIGKDRDGYLWLATYHQGLLKSKQRFDPNDRLAFEPIAANAGSCLLCVALDTDGDLWFGGTNQVLTHYQSSTQVFHYYPVRLPEKPDWSGSVLSLCAAGDGQVWLGTSNGLLLYDRSSGLFSLYDLKVGNIRAIAKESDATVWLGTSSGLIRFDTRKKTVIAKGYEAKSAIPAVYIRSLFSSDDQHVYIGYEDGFGVLDTKCDSIIGFYTTKDGLCSHFIGCIAEDNQHHLWLGSNSGISYYNKQGRQFYNYYISGSNRSVLPLDDFLIWGNNKSVTYFNPSDIRDRHAVSERVLITQLEVDNKPVNIGAKINGQVILTEGIAYTDQIKLSHQNKDFSLLFSNLSYAGMMQKYAYRLIPYQKDWIVCNEGERISYTNLPQDVYAFEVRSLYPDGTDSETTTLTIRMLPPWNKTLWFRLLVIVFALFVVYYIIYRTQKRQKQIEQEALLKNELSIARLEREKEKEIREERERFFTDVSHELRTPLTLILSPLQEILQEKGHSGELHHKLSLVYNTATSLSTLTNHLLYLQKAEAGKVRPDIVKADLCELILKVAESFRPLVDPTKDTFSVVLEKDCMKTYLDIRKVESAIRNILSNAFKYTSSPRCITLSLEEKELDGKCYGVCTVADNGPGIPEDQQAYIFQPFAVGRTNPAFSTKTGIGLRIVKNVMDLHHGRIVLESTPGKGAAFSLHIPLGKEHFSDFSSATSDTSDTLDTDFADLSGETPLICSASQGETPEKSGVSRKKILIIEDNEEVRTYVRSLFASDYQVIEAVDGDIGSRKAISEIPDLIISDIMMPVKDGFACCREIRQHPQTAHIPIIMLTAKSSDTDVLRSMEAGVDDYIMKPFNPEVLKSKVLNLINIREELKRIYTKALMLNKYAKEHADDLGESEKDLFIQQVINIIEVHLTDADFSAKSLAARMNMSHPTLYRKMKYYSDLSVIEIIRSVRISKAASLILQKKYTVQEIAEMVGYNDIASFRKHFVKQFGVPPSKYSD